MPQKIPTSAVFEKFQLHVIEKTAKMHEARVRNLIRGTTVVGALIEVVTLNVVKQVVDTKASAESFCTNIGLISALLLTMTSFETEGVVGDSLGAIDVDLAARIYLMISTLQFNAFVLSTLGSVILLIYVSNLDTEDDYKEWLALERAYIARSVFGTFVIGVFLIVGQVMFATITRLRLVEWLCVTISYATVALICVAILVHALIVLYKLRHKHHRASE